MKKDCSFPLTLKRPTPKLLKSSLHSTAVTVGPATVKLGIVLIKVDGIQFFLYDTERFTETLEVYNFSCTQEADRGAYIGILYKAQDIAYFIIPSSTSSCIHPLYDRLNKTFPAIFVPYQYRTFSNPYKKR